ncbi:B12-binding domain-containing radical SAM protein [Jatrophihabitans sp.]|jgi:hypothetical protein|uniref:B12-binding domain-containing radical SAM protein n=1 Tax=Jatrophihabitans sp. TaxID=1932789 RepID=UPI002EE82310
MTELLLVFPPQWSPFQPALSLPSLSAWLKRAGFDVASVDLNVLFYEWLLSDDCAQILAEEVRRSALSHQARLGLLAIFENAPSFRQDLARLSDHAYDDDESAESYMARNYLAIQSLESYLDAVSTVADGFTVSPYEFRLTSGNLKVGELKRSVSSPPRIIGEFIERAVRQHILPAEPAVVGLSCIGQEQLYFTLLLGARLKQELGVPVIIGGTIFSRIFERGALLPEWFDRYFDVIVRNEGEKPAERLLANVRAGRPLTADVPGIVYARDGRIESSSPCPPLNVAELPIPDFDDLPLGRYISPEVTLPLLSARGCYWGKCEFCHHGMVYGEKYAPYKAPDLLDTIRTLSDRYGVTHFAFNDEALPPTTARAISRLFPPHAETAWTFTGLIKFEPSYTRDDFEGMHRAGFRSLYVGLESASERVLDLMRKRSKRETIVANLTDATESGIWMHCFLFFGFPGEREEDARTTYDFILENPGIVSSFGAGTFSLEHNAPIFKHVEDFGVELRPTGDDDVDVYYRYDARTGISAGRALEWQGALYEATRRIPSYSSARWVPRELLLCMLSHLRPRDLQRVGLTMRECGGFPAATRLREITSRVAGGQEPGSCVVINRMNGRVTFLKPTAADLFALLLEHDVDLRYLQTQVAPLFDSLAFLTDGSGEPVLAAGE